jgi:hypothetical protein
LAASFWTAKMVEPRIFEALAYSMEFASLSTGLKVFLSRAVSGPEGEAGIYRYTDENRHMVEAFRRGENPAETVHDGVGVMEMLMRLYRSAELGRTVHFRDPELERYVPQVARPNVRQFTTFWTTSSRPGILVRKRRSVAITAAIAAHFPANRRG